MNTQLLILQLLSKQDMYGYEMIEELKVKSGEAFDLKVGTLYPLLHKLEINGHVKSYERVTETNKVRKYYSLTPKGEKLLGIQKSDWKKYMTAVQKVLGSNIYE
ncbi:MAG: hypothetical protein BEN19_04095 [Epulopiscium sp. Nuni2H_MBin003]|nr:MAG: hypothetical protein BEN19_04095 [Epulopiscium sp. Nuni2H_MBin003]